jgi:gamma-butyrobetaine dioxygenase
MSAASQETLLHQGGAMSEREALAFADHPLHHDLLRLRAWDEQARVPSAGVPGIATYDAVVRSLLVA